MRERKRGSFSRGSKAFVHFHADDDGFYADARLDEAFSRLGVTTAAEQADFLSRVREVLAGSG